MTTSPGTITWLTRPASIPKMQSMDIIEKISLLGDLFPAQKVGKRNEALTGPT